MGQPLSGRSGDVWASLRRDAFSRGNPRPLAKNARRAGHPLFVHREGWASPHNLSLAFSGGVEYAVRQMIGSQSARSRALVSDPAVLAFGLGILKACLRCFVYVFISHHRAEPLGGKESMKVRIAVAMSLFLVVVAMASFIPSRAQEASTAGQQPPANGALPANPLRGALLRWYRANRTTSFSVGSQPYGVAFDGANIWTANFGDGTVTKLRANDGEVLGTFKAGAEPYGVTFDGANIWVSNVGDGTVDKLRASDGKNLGTFTVGAPPGWMAFDGGHVWLTHGNNAVAKLRASDGKILGIFTVGSAPIATAFDGANIWVTNDADNTVTKLRASDGKVLGTFTVGRAPIGIAFDGANIWVANGNDGTVSKLRASDGKTLGTFKAPGAPYGVAFDGASIWVSGDPYVFEFRASDGTMLGQWYGAGGVGIAFDGANIWLARLGTNAVHKF